MITDTDLILIIEIVKHYLLIIKVLHLLDVFSQMLFIVFGLNHYVY